MVVLMEYVEIAFVIRCFFFFQAEDGIRDLIVTGVQTCALPIWKRHFEELGPALLKLKKSTRELADGYEFEFPADETTFHLLMEWAMQERLCCPFFEINLRFEKEGGPLWLCLTGREGVKGFIEAD